MRRPKFHPDRNKAPEAALRFKQIQEAFEQLTEKPTRSRTRSKKPKSDSSHRRKPPSNEKSLSDPEKIDRLTKVALQCIGIPPGISEKLDFEEKRNFIFYYWAGGLDVSQPGDIESSGYSVPYFNWKRAKLSAIEVLKKWNLEFPSLEIPHRNHLSNPRIVAVGVVGAIRDLKHFRQNPAYFDHRFT